LEVGIERVRGSLCEKRSECEREGEDKENQVGYYLQE
jgi:hypothetical protein